MSIVLIKKGNNNRSNHLLTRFKLGWRFFDIYMVRFDASAQYHLKANKTQVNKLIGVGHVHHHINSIRVGWRWDEELCKVELVGYRYRNGRMDYAHLCYVDINRDIELRIMYEYDHGTINTIVSCGFDSVRYVWNAQRWYEKIPFLYECYPYFGGYMPAPNDIRISIERLSSFFYS